MKAEQNIATIVQLLKGESSFWVNKQNLIQGKLGWQDEYFAVSISHSQINEVRKYIQNQEKHHQKRSFSQEYNDFIAKYGFKADEADAKIAVEYASEIITSVKEYLDKKVDK